MTPNINYAHTPCTHDALNLHFNVVILRCPGAEPIMMVVIVQYEVGVGDNIVHMSPPDSGASPHHHILTILISTIEYDIHINIESLNKIEVYLFVSILLT